METPGTSAILNLMLASSFTNRESPIENRAVLVQDPSEPPPAKDWEELEARYAREMDAAIQKEASIMAEIETVMKVD